MSRHTHDKREDNGTRAKLALYEEMRLKLSERGCEWAVPCYHEPDNNKCETCDLVARADAIEELKQTESQD